MSEHTFPHQDVEIMIDRKRLHSPRETTHAALYTLGMVPTDYILYRETPGPREDEPIINSGAAIHLTEFEKFYSSPGKITPGAPI